MKMIVMSDNHASRGKMQAIIDQFRPQVDYIIHCGDSEFPAQDAIWDQVDIAVAGNMDFDPQYPATKLVSTLYGSIFVAHGHRHEVNFGKDHLRALAKKSGYRFVFHGHTHQLYSDYEEGILFLNPGSLRQSRGPIKDLTFALVEINEAQISVDFYNDDQIKLEDLSKVWERLDD